ncbi:MAG TPA: Gp19/Gp15/Gp42 family protein [Arthrobacter sp.]
MSYVTPEMIGVEVGRTLTEMETARAEQLIKKAEVRIRAKIPNLDSFCLDSNYQDLLDSVITDAVARVLRNPMGIETETEGDRTVGLDTTYVATGRLKILDEEWALLGGSAAGAYTLNVHSWRMGQQGPPPIGWTRDGRPVRLAYLTFKDEQ